MKLRIVLLVASICNYSVIIGMRDTYIHDINKDGVYLANSSDAFLSDNGIGKINFNIMGNIKFIQVLVHLST